jgi:hypothetical protein
MTVVLLAPFRRAPLQSMTLLPVIWDGSNSAGNQVSYTAGSAPSGGQGTLLGYGNIEGGTRNPSIPPGRVTVVAALGSRSGYCIKQVCYDTDPASVMPVGSSANPAAAANSPQLISTTVNSNVYIAGSVWLPGPGNARSDNAFPIVPSAAGVFFQLLEVYGLPYNGSPPWELDVRSLDGGTTNSFIVPSQISPSFPRYWQSSASVVYETWNDYVFHLGFGTTASADGGLTGGFLELWWGPNNTSASFGSTLVQQTFNSNAAYTLANSGKTLCIPTATAANWNGASPNTVNYDAYRKGGQFTGAGVDPVTVYHSHQKVTTTLAAANS